MSSRSLRDVRASVNRQRRRRMVQSSRPKPCNHRNRRQACDNRSTVREPSTSYSYERGDVEKRNGGGAHREVDTHLLVDLDGCVARIDDIACSCAPLSQGPAGGAFAMWLRTKGNVLFRHPSAKVPCLCPRMKIGPV